MGFIREPEGVDFVIVPSQTVKEDVIVISKYIQEHKAQVEQSMTRQDSTSSAIIASTPVAHPLPG